MRQAVLLPTAGRLAALALLLTPVCPTGSTCAGADQETVEVRGEQMAVWPTEDLRKRGFDVSEIPRDENAAWIYIDAGNTYLDVPNELGNAFDYAVKKGWPQDHQRFKKWLTSRENREAIKLARKGSKMERCQMPCFGDPEGSVIGILLPNLRHFRMLAKIVVADGRRLAAQKDYRGAMENYTSVLRMGHDVTQGITVIESLVGVACWNIGESAVRDLVLRHDIPKQDLAAIFEEWKELAPRVPTVRRGFESERLMGTSIVDEVVSRPTHLMGGLRQLSQYQSVDSVVRVSDGWDRLEARLGQVFLPDRTIKRHMADHYDTLIEMARLPYYDERVRNFDESELIRSIPEWDVLSRVMLPSLARARVLGVRCRTETRVTAVALALRLHALENRGKYPAQLADLGVEIDPEDLVDPFGGGEFAYVKNAGAWKLYSVGPDGRDNDGKPGKRWDTEGTDMVCVFPPDPVEPFESEEN